MSVVQREKELGLPISHLSYQALGEGSAIQTVGGEKAIRIVTVCDALGRFTIDYSGDEFYVNGLVMPYQVIDIHYKQAGANSNSEGKPSTGVERAMTLSFENFDGGWTPPGIDCNLSYCTCAVLA